MRAFVNSADRSTSGHPGAHARRAGKGDAERAMNVRPTLASCGWRTPQRLHHRARNARPRAVDPERQAGPGPLSRSLATSSRLAFHLRSGCGGVIQMKPAWLVLIALTACSTSIFDSGTSGAACGRDPDCGAGAYCELPLASCAGGGEIATSAGACHRSCANGACSCLSDADCPGGSCNSGTCEIPMPPCSIALCSPACPEVQLAEVILWRLPLLLVPQPRRRRRRKLRRRERRR